jgi:hypothetical protein
MPLLSELAKEITSKNAGNFAVTFDVVFDDEATFTRILQSQLMDPAFVADLLRVTPGDIIAITPFPPGRAVKIAVRRIRSSGDVGESDVFGAQQYAPLLDVAIP